MRRLNVQFPQIEECISTSLFAIDALPRNPPLVAGEELLLQLVLRDAQRLGKEHQRIEFALIFEEALPDPTGAISRQHWPNAGKAWDWILRCSETVPAVPFSLEDLPLTRNYSGQLNAQYIDPADAAIIRPFLVGPTVPGEFTRIANPRTLLTAIRNYDRVYELAPRRDTLVREHRRRLADSRLGDLLKTFYGHRCQVCEHDFEPRFGVPFADTRFIAALEEGGEPVSVNTVVLCPNHNAIIGAAHADFVRPALAFRFPNGLTETLALRDHLLAS